MPASRQSHSPQRNVNGDCQFAGLPAHHRLEVARANAAAHNVRVKSPTHRTPVALFVALVRAMREAAVHDDVRLQAYDAIDRWHGLLAGPVFSCSLTRLARWPRDTGRFTRRSIRSGMICARWPSNRSALRPGGCARRVTNTRRSSAPASCPITGTEICTCPLARHQTARVLCARHQQGLLRGAYARGDQANVADTHRHVEPLFDQGDEAIVNSSSV